MKGFGPGLVKRHFSPACCVIASLCALVLMLYTAFTVMEFHAQDQLLNDIKYSPSEQGLSYRNISPFLKSSSDGLSVAPVPFFLRNVKNPCFAVDKNNMTFENISIQTALQHKLKIKCLPYVYQIGVTKSGSTDLFAQFTRFHPQILLHFKEMHFWDDSRFLSPTMDQFTQQLGTPTKEITKSFAKSPSLSPEKQYIIAEGTPRTFWDGNLWMYDPLNQGLDVPKILVPQKIHRVTPQNKLIVIMRDPTTRLFSDYNCFLILAGTKSSTDFHRKVLKSIEWWKRCIELHPEKRCLYGPAPAGLPPLDIDKCILDRKAAHDLYMKNIDDEQTRKCVYHIYWGNNTAGRLRIGLYEPIIREWLSVFPREQILFIKFEDYIRNNFEVIQNQIYPFLGLPKLTGKNLRDLKTLSGRKPSRSRNHLTMLTETKTALREFYAPYNKKLFELLGDEKWLWKE